MKRFAVVGAGIAGLAAAYDLARDGDEVVVYEASDRIGGKLHTVPFAGVQLDAAPDAFLARRPEAVQLCDEVGLRPRFVSPAVASSYVWSRGALRSIPKGQVLGVPTDFVALARSGIVSWRGALRAAFEPWLGGEAMEADSTVAEVIGRRFGTEVLQRMVDPLIGGINAGHADLLSIDVVAPQLAAAARTDRSMTRALRSLPPPTGGPVFFGIEGGMERLVDALVEAIESRRGKFHTGETIESAEHVDADGVVWAVPRPDLVAYSSVVLVTFAYPSSATSQPLDASGFLVPRPENLLMTACSWASSKWAHLAVPGRFILRVSAGRHGDDRAMGMSDADLVARLRDELALTMGVRGEPAEVAVHRWANAFPQYEPGHLHRIGQLQDALPANVALAGAALGGVGIPQCIATGRAAAVKLRG